MRTRDSEAKRFENWVENFKGPIPDGMDKTAAARDALATIVAWSRAGRCGERADFVVVLDDRQDRPAVRVYPGDFFHADKVRLARSNQIARDSSDRATTADLQALLRTYHASHENLADFRATIVPDGKKQLIRTYADGKVVLFTWVDDCPFPLPDGGTAYGT